jgi:hypothetical protein
VLRLSSCFVPAADEVHRLQTGKDAECRHFQGIAEQGHYAGRVKPSSTRQGIYAAAPSGVLLASINSRDAKAVAGMLERALEEWEGLAREQRLMGEVPSGEDVWRWERMRPEDGLILRVSSRDLMREEGEVSGWRALAWNRDVAWFRKEEARAFLPERIEAGATGEVPAVLVERLARLHLLDNVRGQVQAFAAEDIERARLGSRVSSVEDGVARVVFEGETRTRSEGRWPVQGFEDGLDPEEQSRGYEARLVGRGSFDLASGRFRELELVALGQRWGGTQFNGRHDDLAPSTMGVALVQVSGVAPEDRVAPALIWLYGWR